MITSEISDATVEIYQAQLNDFEPLDEIPRACHIVADTNYALAEVLVDVERRIRLHGEPANRLCKRLSVWCVGRLLIFRILFVVPVVRRRQQ